MSWHRETPGFAAAQRAYDNAEPPEYEDSECDICIYFIRGTCRAKGDIDDTGDCPSFKD